MGVPVILLSPSTSTDDVDDASALLRRIGDDANDDDDCPLLLLWNVKDVVVREYNARKLVPCRDGGKIVLR